MHELSRLELSEAAFVQLAEICVLDRAFPNSYEGWEDLTARANRDAANQGRGLPAPLHLDPTDFGAWCQYVQVMPCLDSLRAYAVVVRRRRA
jgi:hypothetical protein